MARSTLPFEYAVRNLTRSPLKWALSLCGASLVVGLVLAAAAFVQGMQDSLTVVGGEHNIILLSSGSEESIERSQIDVRVATVATTGIPGIRTRLGQAYVSPEVHLALTVTPNPKKQEGRLAVVRGVTAPAFLVHPQVRIVEGRAPEPARDEIIIGSLVAPKLGLEVGELGVGRPLWIDGRPWTIVGRFSAPQTVMEAEIWAPLTDMQVVAQRDSLSCVVITVEDPHEGLVDAETFAIQRLDLEVVAMSEREYYKKLFEFFGPIRVLVFATALLIALGGLFGGLNTMAAAFSARVRELGALQVFGYSRFAIGLSLMQESILNAAFGSLIAVGFGLLFLDGIAVRFSMGAFGLVVDGPVVAIALVAGLVFGVLGAVPPLIRCLRLPIPEALKS
ncbi:MAG: ABC transporter permease [Planctomycetota bacterium]|jgi:putative ABC transport system permease protein